MLPYLLGAPWTLADYVVAGALLTTAGLAAETVFGKVANQRKRRLLLIFILLLLVYVWAELAVGIFTTLGS